MNAFSQKTFNANDVRKLVLYPVITGILLMLVGAVLAHFTTTRSNSIAIKSLELSKVDYNKFNHFVKVYAEHAVLVEERHKIINGRLDKLEERQRKIELQKLTMIERNIAILQEKMELILQEYGYYTRDSSEIKVNPLFFIKELPNT